MANIFDRLKRNTFDVIAVQMGYTATWGEITARVLVNNPSEKEEEADHFYDYQRVKMEYKETDFPGLRELIEQKSVQTIVIEETEYKTLKIIGDSARAKDGAVYTVSLQKV